jgi:hypothetical protein
MTQYFSFSKTIHGNRERVGRVLAAVIARLEPAIHAPSASKSFHRGRFAHRHFNLPQPRG